ncbi:hypothetical protein B0H14DRAFT_2589868 [Mycena olivaceomarginata]|nr:hypothetical protein B0H14DRAFT_2589868 [Mycena olivaceomarginata]
MVENGSVGSDGQSVQSICRGPRVSPRGVELSPTLGSRFPPLITVNEWLKSEWKLPIHPRPSYATQSTTCHVFFGVAHVFRTWRGAPREKGSIEQEDSPNPIPPDHKPPWVQALQQLQISKFGRFDPILVILLILQRKYLVARGLGKIANLEALAGVRVPVGLNKWTSVVTRSGGATDTAKSIGEKFWLGNPPNLAHCGQNSEGASVNLARAAGQKNGRIRTSTLFPGFPRDISLGFRL